MLRSQDGFDRKNADDEGLLCVVQEAMGSSEVVMAHEEVVAPAAWSPLNLVHKQQPTGVRLAHTSPVAKVGGRKCSSRPAGGQVLGRVSG